MKIVCFSDQHGKLDFTIPECDLALCAGDCCPDFAPGTSWGSGKQEAWLEDKWIPWMGEQRYIATYGNHDFVSRYAGPKSFKVDQLVEIDGIKIWMSPWSNTFHDWAWMKDPAELVDVYARIPDGTDIIVSHQPPYGLGDKVPDKYIQYNEDPSGHIGSKELLVTIKRVKPKYVVCGHIHNGRGTYQIDDTTVLNVAMVNEEYQRVYEVVEIVL